MAIPLAVLLVAAAILAASALGHSAGEPSAPPTGTTAAAPTAPATTPGTRPMTPVPTPATPSAPLGEPTGGTGAGGVSSAPPPPPRAATDVAIVTAGWRDGAVAVSGFVSVVEAGGTCTVSLTRGDVTVTASRPAAADATTTSCGVIEVRDGRLTPGTWQAVLTYSSSTSTGTSAPSSITIG